MAEKARPTELMIRVLMAGLVEKAGGVDSSAALIGEVRGVEVSKGTISKCLSGLLDWSLANILALQSAVGDDPVTRWMTRKNSPVGEGQDLIHAVTHAARESGEAVSASIDYASGRGDRARARKEAQELLDAARNLAALLEASDDQA